MVILALFTSIMAPFRNALMISALLDIGKAKNRGRTICIDSALYVWWSREGLNLYAIVLLLCALPVELQPHFYLNTESEEMIESLTKKQGHNDPTIVL